MKKEKLSLNSLQVNSFVVGMEQRAKTIAGGLSAQGQGQGLGGTNYGERGCVSENFDCSGEPCN